MKNKGQRIEQLPEWYARFSNYKECAKIGCYSRTFHNHKYCKSHDERDSHQIECVYFVLSPETSSVKIGYSSNLKNRFSSLQTSSPCELILFTQIIGDRDLESRLHEHLTDCRIRGEWFRTDDKVINVMSIAKHKGQIGIDKYLSERLQ